MGLLVFCGELCNSVFFKQRVLFVRISIEQCFARTFVTSTMGCAIRVNANKMKAVYRK